MSEPPDHVAHIRQALNTIRNCWDEMLPDSPRQVTTGTIGRTDSKPLPIPVHTLDVRAQALARLASWCLLVIEDQDLHPRLDGLDAVGMARFLDTHADYLASHPAAEDVVDELGESARKIDRVVDRPGPLEFVGRCEVCGGDLRARDKSAALCRDCGASVDAAATREQLTREAEDRLMTAAELVAIAHRLWDEPVTHVRISRWVKSGQLSTHGHVQDGERKYALHRVGDVSVLVARQTTRTG